MEINSTHGLFHVRAGGDEKLKNYFAGPYYALVYSAALEVKKKGNKAVHRIYRLRKSADIYIAKSKEFKTAQRTLEINKLMNKKW